ncbi:MAG: hypothetical protein BAJALOKI3v1_50026 [Promethearchaeota archaeon]|nr:MAG: hypothetical protein BAJALOKI3v1_50026 [Candidatus Lokiarchaeota archaeon]
MSKIAKDMMSWMTMNRNDVMNKFHNINGAFRDFKDEEKDFVYIEGSRKDPVLLIAHADTVWDNNKKTVSPKLKNGIIYSENDIGIGADDRAGCWILWQLRKLGHSILITSGEEKGCKTSRWMEADDEYWKEELQKHQFAVQFDRKGYKDIVCYDVGTDDFMDYVANKSGYKSVRGSNTDVAVICDDICGVNISTGYYDEHTENERLVVDHTLNTMIMAKHWLSEDKIPKFKFKFSDKHNPKYTNNNSYTGYTATTGKYKKFSDLIECPSCKSDIEFSLLIENMLECPSCGNIL